jgi:hypothetical protein
MELSKAVESLTLFLHRRSDPNNPSRIGALHTIRIKKKEERRIRLLREIAIY